MRIFASILAVLFVTNLNAQNDLKDKKFPQTIGEYISFFDLNEVQVEDLIKLFETNNQQIEEINSLKSEDIETYIEKRNAINKGFTKSIQLILNKSQIEAFAIYVDMKRLQNQKIRTELTKAGKSEQEIKLAVAEN